MSVRPRLLLAVVLAMSACRRTAPLDEVQRMTYGVKPALVRVNAYATAKFVDHSPAARAPQELDTGAGGFGSGFIVHPDGYILTSGHVLAATHDPAAPPRELLRNGARAALTKRLTVEQLRELRNDDRLDASIEAEMRDGDVKDIHVVNDAELSNGEKLPFRVEQYSPALNEHGADLALLRIDR